VDAGGSSMNHRLTATAAVAVILASVSMYAVIQGAEWLYAGVGAVITVALAGTLTRLATLPAAGAAAGVALVACSPLLIDRGWYWKATGLLIVAVAAASATRPRIFRVLAGLITYLGALLLYLNAVFAAPQSVLAVLPTKASLHHMWLLASQGLAEKQLAPPVPGIHGIMLLTAGGIGLMAAATDLLAVRLRSPAIAGLPLLVLFSVPIATNAQQSGVGGAMTFCLGITGYLALLAADGRERLRIWGRLITVWQSADDEEQVRGPDTRALAAGGRRVGLAAVCLAIIVPLVLPSMRAHGIFAKHEVPGAGGQAVTLPNPLARMKAQLLLTGQQTVLTYQTDNPDPPSQYLQVYVLDYDSSSGTFKIVAPTPGESVTVGRTPLRRAPGLDTQLVPSPRYSTKVTLGRLTSGLGSRLSFLPMPYAPQAVSISGDWQEDNATLMVYSGQQNLSGVKYTVTSTEPDPSPSELGSAQPLPDNIKNGYLNFSSNNVAALRKIAKRITKGASTPYQKAVALETWFTKPGASPTPSPPTSLTARRDCSSSCRRTGRASASSSRTRWPSSPGWSGSRLVSPSATRRGRTRATGPGRSPARTLTPGQSCTSGTQGGCDSSPRRAALPGRAQRPCRGTSARAAALAATFCRRRTQGRTARHQPPARAGPASARRVPIRTSRSATSGARGQRAAAEMMPSLRC